MYSYYVKNNPKKALEYLENIKKLPEKDIYSYRGHMFRLLEEIHIDLGQIEKAIEILEKQKKYLLKYPEESNLLLLINVQIIKLKKKLKEKNIKGKEK